jgi:hypothetical protein
LIAWKQGRPRSPRPKAELEFAREPIAQLDSERRPRGNELLSFSPPLIRNSFPGTEQTDKWLRRGRSNARKKGEPATEG